MMFVPHLQVQAACGLPRRVTRLCRGRLGVRMQIINPTDLTSTAPREAAENDSREAQPAAHAACAPLPEAGNAPGLPCNDERFAVYVTQLGAVGCLAALSKAELQVRLH